MNLIYFSIIVAILTELLPNLGLSYYYPPDKSLLFYDSREQLRWLVVIIVWIPIFLALFKLSKLFTIIASFFIFVSFYINKNSNYKKKVGNIGYFHLIGFSIIYYILQKKETNQNKLIYIMYILSLLIGGGLMGKYRKHNLSIDIIGRLLFSFGFYNFAIILINKK